MRRAIAAAAAFLALGFGVAAAVPGVDHAAHGVRVTRAHGV